jgi:hypothetical protein
MGRRRTRPARSVWLHWLGEVVCRVALAELGLESCNFPLIGSRRACECCSEKGKICPLVMRVPLASRVELHRQRVVDFHGAPLRWNPAGEM